ncbi:hypothetical protein [Hydrogenophaga sp.]|uniref:hypothetical protein n=1 Tax=Hydrogenophaga sp. TaxID=1904254 RepID=UPI003F7274CB
MTRCLTTLALVGALVLSGCAATVSKPTASAGAQASGPSIASPSVPTTRVVLLIQGAPAIQASKDWNTFRAEWRTAFEASAASAGLAFAYYEAEPPAQPRGTTLVRISVKDYRYLTSGARYGFGIMTGNAFIDASAEFVELPMKRRLGTGQYATSSTAWQGIFSAMTDKQVAALSNEIVQDIRRK